MPTGFPQISSEEVRQSLLDRWEIALLDVREEDPHAQAHPLFAANFPASRIELEAYTKLPRRDVPIALLDNDEGDVNVAAQRLIRIGYSNVRILAGGLAGWKRSGGEIFGDVNVPSKAFGEFVEAHNHTPSLSAQEVKALLDSRADVVVVDVRRFDEYQSMSIPTGISVPGAELVLRVPALAPRSETRVIVNCAGRTRSIIGTQSLINAGLPNPVAALRNGTIGWTLAGQALDHGQTRRFPEVSEESRIRSARTARDVAGRAGVSRASSEQLDAWRKQEGRTTYFFDVRTPEEYEKGHLPGFVSAPGGQLVQETEMFAPVRGARIVLADSDGVRANMTASWLAQMAWEVHVLDDLDVSKFSATGPWQAPLPSVAENRSVQPRELSAWLQAGQAVVIDVTASARYRQGHIPGAWFALRSQLDGAIRNIPVAERYVLTCGSSLLARFVAPELASLVANEVFVLAGGTRAWSDAGFALESGVTRLASPPIDRYRRPYEGTEAPAQAMQAYLDWEFGLVEQLKRDGTHHFRVI